MPTGSSTNCNQHKDCHKQVDHYSRTIVAVAVRTTLNELFRVVMGLTKRSKRRQLVTKLAEYFHNKFEDLGNEIDNTNMSSPDNSNVIRLETKLFQAHIRR
ncbi:hypothetical protein ElyMa_001291700 [Elysia marginata]|uniref:Uncharacterized protein n=1 Tax=Elysia marginata TaxID=1093978 RepID=A0AAV4IFR9_9GAST|nr:hypothetical protein ElyMa_001291700 [Elysia marginata]